MIEIEEFLVCILLGLILGGLISGIISAIIQFLDSSIKIDRFFCTAWLILATIITVVMSILCI